MKMHSRLLILAILMMGIAACSESNKTTTELPPIIENLNFPFIKNNSLYEFDPESGESKIVEAHFTEDSAARLSLFIGPDDENPTLVSSPEGHIVYLDTDEAEEVQGDDSNSSLIHTLLPELIAYSKGSSIFLFELVTRYAHPIVNFEPVDGKPPLICDIRPSLTLDEENRLIDEILYKNEHKLYVKTAPEDCALSTFNYYQIDLEQDPDTEYEIRRISINSHTHVSSHSHTHTDDHDHDHAYEAGEIGDDGLPFDPNNHPHYHTHEHDFFYGHHEEHLYLSKEEIDEVHSLASNQETSFEKSQAWVGRVTNSSEALMYAEHPVYNTSTKEFGYLGFNYLKNQYEFYIKESDRNFDTLEYSFGLTELGVELINRDPNYKNNQDQWFTYIENAILFRHNDALIKLPTLAIFDRGHVEEREDRFETPIFVFQNPEDSQLSYHQETDRLYIRDGLNLHMIEGVSTEETLTTLKEYSAAEVEDIRMISTSQNIIIRKFFAEDNQQSNIDSSSSVQLTGDLGLFIESAGLPSSDTYTSYIEGSDDNILIHLERETDGQPQLFAQNFDSELYTSHFPDIANSIWGRISNLFDSSGAPVEQAIINSNDTTLLSVGEKTIPALINPNIYQYNQDHDLGHGALIGTLPGNIAEVIDIDIKSQFHGEVKVKDSYEHDAPVKTYFFPSSLSFINPTGSFGDMKFMYDDTSEEPSESEELLEEAP